jgi:predicted ATPase/DNA-binding winged helix-turn-helix (wHTH) protein
MPNTPSPLPSEGLRNLHFGRFELRPQEYRLLADGEPVALGGRAFELLLALVQRAGQLVTRNELIEQVWPGRVVEENNLSVQVNALRKALGGEWLVTVPGRGYRFVAPLVASGRASSVASASPVPAAVDVGPSTAAPTPALPVAGTAAPAGSSPTSATTPAAVNAATATAAQSAQGAQGAQGAKGARAVQAVQAATSPARRATDHATPAGPRTNLPTLQPLLIGRSDDLAALGTLIDQHRLVTVVGAGGMGKTRLAQALMQMRANAYPQGVCWVELGNVTTPEALPVAVATALGLQSTPGDAPAQLAHLARSVSGLQMLIALDNAEHLLEAAARLAQALLDAEPGLRMVATSQAPLRLAHERVYRLGPLAVPQGPLPSQQAQAFGAVALFCERAAAADHRFDLADADVPAVIELCRQLDGVALAIELAAARAPALGLAQLLAALSDRLRVFSSNRNRLAPARQQSLRAALDWSVGLLPPFEQQLFRRLAVVAGSASLTLVQHLGALADRDAATALDPWAVVDALDQLIQRSLVEVVQAEGPFPPRYRLLESPRALALEQLAASGEEAALRMHHAQGVLAEFNAGRAALHAAQLGVQDWRRLGELEMDNARAALAHIRLNPGLPGMPALELALASAMMPAALNAERLALADHCEQLIAAATGTVTVTGSGTVTAIASPTATATATPTPTETEAAGQLLDLDILYAAWREISVALANMRPTRSLAAARQALALARQRDAAQPDRYALHDALCAAGQMLVDEEPAAAASLMHEALALADPSWPPIRQLPALRVQASIATERGQAEDALRFYRRLLDVGRAAGDPGLATQLNIANAELVAGDAAAAVASGTQVVALARSVRNENLLVFARVNLAAAHLMLGQTEPARQQLQEALPSALRAPLHAWCIGYLALLAALEGRLDAAAKLEGAAAARYEAEGEQLQVNEQRAHERTLGILRTAWDQGRVDAAIESGRGMADAELARLGLDGG